MSQRRAAARKSLGQNFLVSPGVVDRIAAAVLEKPLLPVIEIGPGRGALTIPLAASGAPLAAFEIDAALAQGLREKLAGCGNAEIVTADVRRVDFDAEASGRGWPRYAVAGNIPYLLTSTILIGLSALGGCRRAVIMVQKEVGERVLAAPGERRCGILSVYLQAFFDVSRVMTVGAGSFRPRPKVDSVVLRFVPARRPGAPGDRAAFLVLLKAAFSQRRKKLANVLAATWGAAAAAELAARSGVDTTRRAEQLAREDWFALFAAARGKSIV